MQVRFKKNLLPYEKGRKLGHGGLRPERGKESAVSRFLISVCTRNRV